MSLRAFVRVCACRRVSGRCSRAVEGEAGRLAEAKRDWSSLVESGRVGVETNQSQGEQWRPVTTGRPISAGVGVKYKAGYVAVRCSAARVVMGCGFWVMGSSTGVIESVCGECVGGLWCMYMRGCGVGIVGVGVTRTNEGGQRLREDQAQP